MYQCILNVPLWNDWRKETYSQVHGSPVLKTLLLQSFSWFSATTFAELIQFWQDPKCKRNRTFWWKKFSDLLEKDFIFHFHIYFSASFASYLLVSDTYIYTAKESVKFKNYLVCKKKLWFLPTEVSLRNNWQQGFNLFSCKLWVISVIMWVKHSEATREVLTYFLYFQKKRVFFH